MTTNLTTYQLSTFLFLSTKGRIGRLTFLLSSLILLTKVIMISLILQFINSYYSLEISGIKIFYTVFILFIYPAFCVLSKRFHDFGLQSNFILILFTLTPVIYAYSSNPIVIYTTLIVSAIVFIVMCLLKGFKVSNNFGKNPISGYSNSIINRSLFNSFVALVLVFFISIFLFKKDLKQYVITPEIKKIEQYQILTYQLKAIVKWKKVVKSDQFLNSSEEKQTKAREGYAKYITNRVKNLNIYTPEQLENNHQQLVAMLKSVEKGNIEEK